MNGFFIEVAVPGMELFPELRDRARALRENGVRVLFLCAPEFAYLYEECSDAIAPCADIFSADAMVEALAPFQGRLDRFSIINDRIWTLQLEVARQLGMPFTGFDGQVNCRVKARMREVLAEVLPLRHVIIRADELTRANVAAAVEHVGVPFVIKPIWGTASAFVDVVKDAGQAYDTLAETFDGLTSAYPEGPFDDGERTWDPRGEVLLEEFLTGRELSFEAFIQDGELVPLLIQEKLYVSDQDGFRLESGNVCPTPFVSAEEQERIRDILQTVLTTLTVDHTFVHIECKWDGERLGIIEINPRIGGGSVAKSLIEWYGIDVREMILKLHLREPLPRVFERRQDGFLLGVFVNADEGGIFEDYAGLDWVHEQPGYRFEQRYLEPGRRVPQRGESKGTRDEWMYAYDVFYHCTDLDQVDYLHDQTRKRVRMLVTPTHGGTFD